MKSPLSCNPLLYTHLDLFSGIGGFKIALEPWCKTIAFAEVNEWCNKNALQRNWPSVPNVGDVRKLCRRIHHNLEETGDEYDPDFVECSVCGIEYGECNCIGTDEFTDTYGFPDIITAGVPCQPASIIGKRKGVEDSRWLWPDMHRIVEELMPSVVVCEQPTGILSLDKGDRFDEIIERFCQAGFCVWWETIPASAAGWGHRRERVWIVAYRSGERLERHAGDGEVKRVAIKNRPIAPKIVPPTRDSQRWWQDQSPVPVVVHGVSDSAFWKDGVIATGNAIVPGVARSIAGAIFGCV